jgi:pSer/pThr/pTyr-binding forkhead associated (FHA) protein/Mg-chelatase subunit ChlD
MAEQMQYRLTRDDGASWTVAEGGRLSLGRSRQNDVQIADSGVSRRHATVLVAHGRCWIRDEDSTRGTFVNGQRVVGQQEIRLEDRLQIGPATFRLEREPAPVPMGRRVGQRIAVPFARRKRRNVLYVGLSIVVVVVLVVAIGGLPGPSERGAVLAETTMEVNASQDTVVSAGQASVEFHADSLAQDTSVTVRQLGRGSEIAGGILVDTAGTELVEPVIVSFAATGPFESGELVQLLQQGSAKQAWQPATSTSGDPILGFVGTDGSVIAAVDHFSGFGLPNKVAQAADMVEHSISRDTIGVALDNGQRVKVPVEFNADRMLNGADLSFFFVDIPAAKFPWANKGLNDDALREERYKEVLMELFMQTDISVSREIIEDLEEHFLVTEYLVDVSDAGLELSVQKADIGAEAIKEFIVIDRDFLRDYRAEHLHWSKYARLDYVEKRYLDSVRHAYSEHAETPSMSEFAVALKLASDAVIVTKDIHRAFLYGALKDALVIERMDQFEALLSQPGVDPALRRAYEAARGDVEKLLDEAMHRFVHSVMEDWAANLQVAGHVVMIAHAKSFLVLAKFHPVFAIIAFVRAYDNVIVDAYADMQRATLAATLIQGLFRDVDPENVSAGDLDAFDQAMMKIYLGQYYYRRVANRRRGGLIGGIRRLFIGLFDLLREDKQAKLEKERLDYLDSKAKEIKALYERLEAARQAGLAVEKDEEDVTDGDVIHPREDQGHQPTATVLVIDLSTSMEQADPSGMSKIDAAKEAASQLVTQLGQDNAMLGTSHQVALVTFSNDADVAAPFSADTPSLISVIDSMALVGDTNIGAGFEKANQLLGEQAGSAARFIVLMTDGDPNRGLKSLEEFRTGPVAEAKYLGACVMTVGFGADANETLLRGIAEESACGGFYSALDAFELRTVYAQSAAEASGENVKVYHGTVAQGDTAPVCTYEVPPQQSVASFQLMWPGSTLDLQLTNPSGRRVEPDGSRVQVLADSPSTRRVLVRDPEPGPWSVEVVGVDVSYPDGEPFSVIASTIPSTGKPPSDGGGLGPVVIVLVVALAGLGIYGFTRSRRQQLVAAGVGVVGGKPPSVTTLVVLRGPRAGQQIPVAGTMFAIGRSRDSALRLSASNISRRHAVLRYTQGHWFLQDQGSAIGTFVNGQRVTATALSNGDVIRIGDTELQFRIE